MKSVLQLKLGRSTPEDVLDGSKDFYSWLMGVVSGEEVTVSDISFLRTLPIPFSEIFDGAHSIYTEISKALEESFRSSKPEIIIDVITSSSSHQRAHILRHLMLGLQGCLSPLGQGHESYDTRIILLVEEIPHPNDEINFLIENFRKTAHLTLIAHDGVSTSDLVEASEYKKRRIISQHDPRSIIRSKMVRQMGHFQKKSGGRTYCSRHFYDGTHCEDELTEFLYLEILETQGKGGQVLYHTPLSPWLLPSILSLQASLDSRVYDLEVECPSELEDNYCIILDFIDSGKSLSEHLMKLGRRPKRVISILATTTANRGVKTIEYNDGRDSIDVDYVVGAEYKLIGKTPCELDVLGIPIDSLGNMQQSGVLRSLDFWDLVLECGTALESDPPPHRDSQKLRETVNTYDMIRSGGAFIASRIEQLFEIYSLPADCPVVCPADEKASGLLTEHLKLLLKCDVIKIPREIFERYADEDDPHLEDSEKEQEWFLQLTSNYLTQCVIIDDLSVTGKTIVGIWNLLKQNSKKVERIIPMLNLNDGLLAKCDGLVTPLYSWNYYE